MTNNVVCLFIGGPADGERRSVPAFYHSMYLAYVPQEFVEVHELPKMVSPSGLLSKTETIEAYKVATYKRHQLREDNDTFFFYVPVNNRDSIIVTLINGYKKGGAA